MLGFLAATAAAQEFESAVATGTAGLGATAEKLAFALQALMTFIKHERTDVSASVF